MAFWAEEFTYEPDGDVMYGICSHCGGEVCFGDEKTNYNYCPYCGENID